MPQNIGKAGESFTAGWLERRGFRIVARNYHSRYGEIDIIAEDAQYIVFVEVKTRKPGAMVSAVESVTREKQQKIVLTAESYLMKRPSALQPRFDVAAVTTLGGIPQELCYFQNAFTQ